MTIQFHDLHAGDPLAFRAERLVIAGFTGRDRAMVEAHVAELAGLGVPVPGRTPSFYRVDPALLTADDRVTVAGPETSGEVEPVVLVDDDGTRWLTVGSDHTDRAVERTSIPLSKSACPKVVCSVAVRVDDVAARWDDIELASWAGGEPAPYQQGTLAQILALDALLAEAAVEGVELVPGDVMFLGTVPVTDGRLRPEAAFRAEMGPPDGSWRLGLHYSVAVEAGAAG